MQSRRTDDSRIFGSLTGKRTMAWLLWNTAE